MNVGTLAASVGFIASVVVGTFWVNDRFVDHKEQDEAIGGVEQQLIIYAEKSESYLIDLRIEQHEDRIWQLEEKSKKGDLSYDEKKRLNRTNEQLKKLYQIKEEQR